MTTTAAGRQATNACNGVTTVFAVPFRYVNGLRLYLHDSAAFAISTATLLTEGVHYTVAGDGRAGTATVTTLTAYPTGQWLTRFRETSKAQTASYVPGDGFKSAAHETQLDRLSLVDEEVAADLADTADRALLVPDGESAATLPSVADRSGGVLAFDALGDPVATPLYDVLTAIGTDILDDGTWSESSTQYNDGIWG